MDYKIPAMAHGFDIPCCYGENAWQAPAQFKRAAISDPLSLDRFQLVEGWQPSYNTWCDLDRLLQTMTHIAAAWDGRYPVN